MITVKIQRRYGVFNGSLAFLNFILFEKKSYYSMEELRNLIERCYGFVYQSKPPY